MRLLITSAAVRQDGGCAFSSASGQEGVAESSTHGFTVTGRGGEARCNDYAQGQCGTPDPRDHFSNFRLECRAGEKRT